MRIRIIISVLIALLTSSFTTPVFCNVLSKFQLAAPLSPQNPQGRLEIPSISHIDPKSPVWVSYSLIAVSAKENPSGEILIDASPEGVMVPISDSTVTFSPDNMQTASRSGNFAAAFEKQAGNKSQQEIATIFGADLAESIMALKENKGTILEKTIVKTYPAPGSDELRLLASIEKAEGIQPALIVVTIGQGDIPDSSINNISGSASGSNRNEKIITAAISFLIALVFLYKKFKS